jgi:hypothetical protein
MLNSIDTTRFRDRFGSVLLCSVLMGITSLSTTNAQQPLPETINFNRDIRPILSDTCFHCHGPDKTNREADLRLDLKAEAFKVNDDGIRIVFPNRPDKSELYRRIASSDEDERMPPTDAERKLTDRQIALIKRWIEQGADWQNHWSFIPPKRHPLPRVKNDKWIRNPIDAFVLSRLEQQGLNQSTEAAKTTLIRRVTLDITGFPPTPNEVDDYLSDKSPNAYEKVVDRLLKSNRYGERMTMEWLDGARYADTSGYQNDGPRYMWRWRDWVIKAFNGNMPFDQFTIEQIAGDLLPNATLEQKIATAFNRNHRGNAEGGIIPEEFQVEYVVDRVETTFTVWQGLAIGCGRCHEHKYDPISQKEFYQVFAYFNNIPEYGRAIKEGNSPPYIKAPTLAQQQQLARLEKQLSAAEKRFHTLQPKLDSAQAQWEKTFRSETPVDWTVSEGLIAHYRLDGSLVNDISSGKKENSASGHLKDGDAKFLKGRLGDSASFDGKQYIDAGDVANFGYFDKFSFGAWIFPTSEQGGAILSRMIDLHQAAGCSLVLKNGRVQLNLVTRWLDDSIRVETSERIPLNQWTHVFATYDGSRVAKGITISFNGVPSTLNVRLDGINQSFASKEPLRIGGGNGPDGRFHGRIDDLRVYNRLLHPIETEIVSAPQTVSQIVGLTANKRSKQQVSKLRAYFLDRQAPKEIQTAQRAMAALRKQRTKLIESFSTVMVMQESDQPRKTFVLQRGVYDKLGERVSPGIPQQLSPFPKDAPNNRLGFSKWLTDRNNSLTARVTVNRYWQMLFGVGIVKTTEDFGSQGEQPSHPQLLDWLAVQFMESGWDVKAILKTIVMSATYRQSSKVTPNLVQLDPENRFLARGPRFRLPAETIRDQALAISGMLTEKVGGPSVRPYQPAGLWKEIANTNYQQSKGFDLYRRSLYTYWKRTVAPPTMTNFDASTREYCTIRRPRTNTPLQALTLMNDVTFVEAARVLAQRMMIEGGKNPQDRITYAFRLASSRRPTSPELKILVDGFEHYLSEFRRDQQAAKKLISTGESPLKQELDAAELAAYTAVGSLILNLDEVVTKE